MKNDMIKFFSKESLKRIRERKEWWFYLTLVILAVSCGKPEDKQPSNTNYVTDMGVAYLNTDLKVKYVGDKACKECHASIHQTYIETQTGKSMMKVTPENLIGILPQEMTVLDSVRNFYYEMIQRGDRFFQREYRLDPEGNVIHEREMEAHYIMGSGVNLRNYFSVENGMFYELPLSWYENDVKWDLSPGYREFGNVRFNRYASERCFYCHNGRMQPSSTAHERYVAPHNMGIDCEGCHGPGELHVAAKHGENIWRPSGESKTIVNPGKLSSQRRMDVCRQCHLQGQSRALRGENGWFDFRPGMLLASHHSEYFTEKIHLEAFKVANTAFRLEQSRCFTESHGTTDCIICHDSHDKAETSGNATQNTNCQKCHPPDNLPGEGTRFTHTSSDNCVPCHMNQTASDNTLHGVITTDHWIRIDANMTDVDWTSKREDPGKKPLTRLVPYLDANDDGSDTRLGIGYFTYFNETDNRKAYLDSALKYLTLGRKKQGATAVGEFNRGAVLLTLQQPGRAAQALQTAVALNPKLAEAYFKLGEAFKAQNVFDLALNNYREAKSLLPDEPRYAEGLGQTLILAGQPAEAAAVLEESLLFDRQNSHTYYSLGNLYALTLNDPEQALSHFKQLVVIDPDFPNGYLNLGNTFAMLGQHDAAIRTYEKEIIVRPKSINALVNMGRLQATTGRVKQARKSFLRALTINPNHDIAKRSLEQLPK